MGKGKNKSFIFLLPILYNKTEQQKLTYFTNNITNTYIGIDGLSDTFGKLFCLVNNPDNYIYNIVSEISILDSILNIPKKVIFSFNIERSFQSEYKLFLDGRYSKFRPYFKSIILKYWLHENIEDLFGILFKTEKRFNKLKDEDTHWNVNKHSDHVEYLNKPIIKNELLNLTNL
jgi:hypothetical protein